MAPKHAGNNVKKITLKGNKPKVKDFTVGEAMEVAKLTVENQKLTKVDIEKLFDSLDIETLEKLDRYLRHDKSNIAMKIEKVGHFMPSITKFTALRDYINKIIDHVGEIIHDGVVEEFSDENGEDFNFESFKAMVSELKGKKMNDTRMST